MRKNLILGTVEKYSYKDIASFVVSLKKTGFQDDLLLFASHISSKTRDALLAHGVKLISYSRDYPYLADFQDTENILPQTYTYIMSPNCSRYIMYYLYVLKYAGEYSKIMLADIGDVVFQLNPFDFKFSDGLSCFLEDKGRKIKDCPVNSNWIRAVYGDNVLKEIGNNYISCSGVTVGAPPAIMDYLKKMIHYLTKIDAKGGTDQGVHNFLIYKNYLKNVKLFENENGPVLTLVRKRKETIRYNKRGYIINDSGKVVNVIHQYDIYPEVVVRLKNVVYERNWNNKKIRLEILCLILHNRVRSIIKHVVDSIEKFVGHCGVFLKKYFPRAYRRLKMMNT